RGSIVETHAQADTTALLVHFDHLHLHHVAGLHHAVRVLDELVRQGGDVDQTVLMHADVDEGSEVGDVCNRTFQNHAGHEILQIFHAFLQLGRLEFTTRVATRFFQLGDDVLHGRHADGVADVVF